MVVDLWGSFWNQLKLKKDLLCIDNSSFFHYVVLEFLNYKPNEKVSEEEKVYIRQIPKGSEDYARLDNLYRKRHDKYTLS